MRVVLLVTDLERGGTPLRIARLARGLFAAGVEVFVGCLAPRGPVSQELDEAGIATFACDARHKCDLFVLKRLARHLGRIQPDLVHATLFHANLAARLVARRLGIPVLTSTATIEVERRWHRWLERWTARRDCGHIVNSRALAEHVQRAFRLPAEHVHMVPASLDGVPKRSDRAVVRRRFHVGDEEFAVLWIGRFDPVKRLDLIVSCAELVRDAPLRFLLAGHGPLRARFEQTVQRSSVAERFLFLGWQHDLGPVLSAADAFLFPSRTEGLPNAVLQAMAFGLPVVAADIPVLRELAGRPPRLLLCPPDQPQAYVDALLRLRADTELGRRLSAQAAGWARTHLDPDAVVSAHLDIYRGICAEER